VIVRRYALVVRRGAFSSREFSQPLWNLQLQTPQSLIGRFLDYGDVVVPFGEHTLQMRGIAQIRHLRIVVAARQAPMVSVI
jgi:hypothetical protein